MKTKIILIVALIVVCISGIALTMHFAYASKEKANTVVQVTNDPKDNVKVGDIAIKEIHKQLNITSSVYDFTFPFADGTLDEDAGFWETVGHATAGRSYTATVHASAELKTNLLAVSKKDVDYNKETKILSVVLEKPELRVWLNHEKLDSDSFEAVFSNRYEANEINHIYDKMEKSGKIQFETTKINDLENAKEDIIVGLEELLSPDSLIEKADAPKELHDLIRDVHISFKE